MFNLRALFLILLFASLQVSAQADTRYITDQFEVTMRSGTSTSNSIISMLKSGQAVTVIEQDEESRYSLVQLESGKQGYVLTRFLDSLPSGRERYTRLKQSHDQQQQTIKDLNAQLGTLHTEKQDDVEMIAQLTNQLEKTRQELEDLQIATRDTISVLNENETLQTRIQQLDSQIQTLTTENEQYRDSTAMDWFMRGAGVFLGAFLVGILVTRIRWKKRDSWGHY